MKRRSAFTLIELIASALLAAMMMVALMNVVWSAARDTRQLTREGLLKSSVSQLAERLRADFQNARGVSLQGGVVTLRGYLAENTQTLETTFQPGAIQYSAASVGAYRALVRTMIGPTGAMREVIWVGFGDIQLEALIEAEEEDELAPDPAAGGLPEIPASLRVTLTGQDGRIIWREVLHHHEI